MLSNEPKLGFVPCEHPNCDPILLVEVLSRDNKIENVLLFLQELIDYLNSIQVNIQSKDQITDISNPSEGDLKQILLNYRKDHKENDLKKELEAFFRGAQNASFRIYLNEESKKNQKFYPIENIEKNLVFLLKIVGYNHLRDVGNKSYFWTGSKSMEVKSPSLHYLNNLSSLFQDHPNKYSLLQLRFFDYINHKKVEGQTINQEPKPTIGQPIKDDKDKPKDEGTKDTQISKDFSTIFQNTQHIPAQINTAGQFYIPSTKMISKYATSEGAKEAAQPKKRETSTKYTSQMNAPRKLPASTEISKNYDYLFESSISKAGQFNVLDKAPIIISEDQLKCGKPQNSEVKIDVYSFGNNVRISRKHFGSIDFSSQIDNIELVDISSLVDIEERYINFDCKKADEYRIKIDEKEAMVTLENVFPIDQKDNYELSLRNYCQQTDGISFIHYFADKGKLLFYVTNFRNGPFHFPSTGISSKDFVVKCTEIMDATIDKDGEIKNFAIGGHLKVESVKKGKYAIKFNLPEDLSNISIRPLNQIDPYSFFRDKILKFDNSDDNTTIFEHDLLEWVYESKNEIPLNISFKFTEFDDDQNRRILAFNCHVSINRKELNRANNSQNISFQNITLFINVPNTEDVFDSLDDDAIYRYFTINSKIQSKISIKDSIIEWTIIDLDQDNFAEIEFKLPQFNLDDFFPINVSFKSNSLYFDPGVDKIAKGEKIPNEEESQEGEDQLDHYYYDFDQPEKSFEVSKSFTSREVQIL